MPVYIEKCPGRALLAFEGAEALLSCELEERFNINLPPKKYGSLFYYPEFPELPLPGEIYFASTQMLEPFLLHFDSIGQAAGALKEIQRNWAPYQYQHFRRGELIQQKLPYINLKEREFPVEIPHSGMGLYTLLDEHTILAGAKTTSSLPAGRIQFKEDHVNPPSRAYLKLQESLTLARHFFGIDLPCTGQKCFEAGACPGGWTWVLVQLGASVFAVDRAALDGRLMKNPLVQFAAHDAFTLPPEEIGKIDWLFSDVICYPERLYDWVMRWLKSGLVQNIICTIKLQGQTDWALIKKFADIPDSRVVHLNYNKHELTWIHCGQRDAQPKQNRSADRVLN